MGLAWRELLQFFLNHWGCISSFGLLGYLMGSIVTRRVMAPAFCPNCIRQKAWVDELREQKQSTEEKAEARRFYWLRRKRKEKAGDGPKSS